MARLRKRMTRDILEDTCPKFAIIHWTEGSNHCGIVRLSKADESWKGLTSVSYYSELDVALQKYSLGGPAEPKAESS